MTFREYKDKVIELFKSGKATEAQWEAMAASVAHISEHPYDSTILVIDKSVFTPEEFKEIYNDDTTIEKKEVEKK